jgi:hypothetical protein
MNFARAGRFPDRVSAYNKVATASLTPTALTVGSSPAISVVSNSGLSHSTTSGANTSTVTITGEGITIGKNSTSSTLLWDFVGSRLSTYPTINQILGNSRTYFGGTENFEIVTSTHTVPTTGINLDYYLIVPNTNSAPVAITMNALVQHGQRVTTINKGLAGNTINGIPLGTSTVTTSYFDGNGWHHFQSQLLAEAALAGGGSGGTIGNDATGVYVPPASGGGLS